MPSIYEIAFVLLLLYVLPFCLLTYGSYVIYLHRARKGKLKLHRACAYSLLALFVVMWISAAFESTSTCIAEVDNPNKLGNVVQLDTPGFQDPDIHLYVQDYKASGNRLVDLKIDIGGVDGNEIPQLYWSHDKSSLIIDYERQDDQAYDFVSHRMINAGSLQKVLKDWGSQKVNIRWPDEKVVKRWQFWKWGLGFINSL